MNSNQSSFLQNLHAQLEMQPFTDQSNEDIGSPTPESNSIVLLDYYGFLNINGPDTRQFLQGQTTCDLDIIDDSNSRPGASCTPKGRTINSFLLARTHSENYLLRMRRDLVETTKSALNKYIVFSKATAHDYCMEYTCIGLSGTKAATAIANCFGDVPAARHSTVVNNENIALQLDDNGVYYECWIRTSQLQTIWPILSKDLTPQKHQYWQLATIRRGLAEITNITSEAFIPQMLNFHITDTISFTKGCYTGQEVVARMQYKGKLKRQLYHIQVDCDDEVNPGDDLFSSSSEQSSSEQSIGKIVNVAAINGHQSEALAVITKTSVEQDNVHYKKHNSSCTEGNKVNQLTAVKILSLPYVITELT